MRHRLELDDNLAAPLGQALAGTQEKRNALPAPVIDVGLDCDERFGVGRLAKVGVVAADRRALDRTFAILADNDIALDYRAKRAQHLDLFVADGGCIQIGGRLHRGQRQQLQHMILHHVAHRAGVIVKASATLQPDGFANGYLDMLNSVGVP